MKINSQFEHRGKTYKVEYNDGVPNEDTKVPEGVHAYCFYDDKLVIVRNGDNSWSPPGGSIEEGETYEGAAIREIKEESNMNVLHIETIGYQDIEVPEENRTVRQCRMFCIVEPYGDFESDPDGDILEIKFINPEEYKEYFDWGEVGNYVMSKALEMKSRYT